MTGWLFFVYRLRRRQPFNLPLIAGVATRHYSTFVGMSMSMDLGLNIILGAIFEFLRNMLR